MNINLVNCKLSIPYINYCRISVKPPTALRITLFFHSIYYIQYRYCLYRGNGREDGNDDVMRELGWGEVWSKEGGVEGG